MARHPDLDEAAVHYEVMQGSLSAAQVCQSGAITRIGECSSKRNQIPEVISKTATLWLQYVDMVDILRKYIRAERTGNWELHLQTVSEMLPYLAACGHNHYAKSAWIYLQRMSNLHSEHPDAYQHFREGLHVVRSGRHWAGLSSDLIIEQVLMRSLKTGGGLTRGRGITEQQVMPDTVVVHASLC